MEPEAKLNLHIATHESRCEHLTSATTKTFSLTFSKLTSSTSLKIRFPNAPSIPEDALVSDRLRSGQNSHTMAPPCPSLSASELPARIQLDGQGKKRKLEVGKKEIDLSACELFEMLQYKCEVQRPLTRESPVRCFAADRTFRRWVQ